MVLSIRDWCRVVQLIWLGWLIGMRRRVGFVAFAPVTGVFNWLSWFKCFVVHYRARNKSLRVREQSDKVSRLVVLLMFLVTALLLHSCCVGLMFVGRVRSGVD